MLNASRPVEKLLQHWRFARVKPYLIGDVLDFGGNKGELRRFANGKYAVVNYDYASMAHERFDTIAMLAVMEHIAPAEVERVFGVFKAILNPGGRIFLTTPAKAAHPVLMLMAYAGLLDEHNIAEHQHYWNKKEIYDLAARNGFAVKKYKKFQLGFNQLAVLEHKI